MIASTAAACIPLGDLPNDQLVPFVQSPKKNISVGSEITDREKRFMILLLI